MKNKILYKMGTALCAAFLILVPAGGRWSAKAETTAAGQKENTGRKETAGQKENTGQKRAAGQKENAGQKEATGQEENTGQKEAAGQKENTGQKETAGQEEKTGRKETAGQDAQNDRLQPPVEVDTLELENYDIEEDEAQRIFVLTGGISEVIATYEEAYSQGDAITETTLYYYLMGLAEFLEGRELDGVEEVELHPDYIRVVFTEDSGIYIYRPATEGTKAGDGEMNMISFQPFCQEFSDAFKESVNTPDDALKRIEEEFSAYTFDDGDEACDRGYDDQEVTLAGILDMANKKIVFWDGHGGFEDNTGVYLCTPVPDSVENRRKYDKDFKSGRLLLNGGYIAVTPAFFDYYLPEHALDHALIYLGSCKSGYDTSLIDVLIRKGAMAVFANSDTIDGKYDYHMMASIANGLTRRENGRHYTLDRALAYAQEKNGEKDEGGAYVYLTYGDGYADMSLDWYTDLKETEQKAQAPEDDGGVDEAAPQDGESFSVPMALAIAAAAVLVFFAVLIVALAVKKKKSGSAK